MGLAVVCQLSLTGSAGATTTTTTAKAAQPRSVKPNPVNELDCNGWSPKYTTIRAQAGMDCVDPIKVVGGKTSRFIDNGWYVGHDEPSVKFISTAPGSGNTMIYLTKIPVDPRRSPTASGSVTDYAQLSVAPWFGLPICDPKSFPQNSCTPDSDTNIGTFGNPAAAGSAFMELQLYAPGFTPFFDDVSCSATKWCAALNIDSLECNAKGACNGNCIEPLNFAFLQTNGVPSGPPSPQLANNRTFFPNRHTLEMNPGDVLAVAILDPPQGFTTIIRDLTTHQTGFMTASARNGFMNTNIADCSGTPFTFHAEYSSASIQNQVPWADLEGGVLMEQEIGHSEVCSSVKNKDPFLASFPFGQTFIDPQVFDTCVGGSEGKGRVGEGPCNPTDKICQNAETQGTSGPVACPTDSAVSGALCEFADGSCFRQGFRTLFVNGAPVREESRANQCLANRFQNGDLDFNGVPYHPNTWPNGSRNHPTAFQYIGPFQANGRPYPQVQFESDIGASSSLCDVTTGAGCTVAPIGAKFYPFWSLSRFAALGGFSRVCVWNFGNTLPNTFETLGKDTQYGTPNVARFGGTIISAPMANPEFSGRCRL